MNIFEHYLFGAENGFLEVKLFGQGLYKFAWLLIHKVK